MMRRSWVGGRWRAVETAPVPETRRSLYNRARSMSRGGESRTYRGSCSVIPISAARLHYSLITEWDPRDDIYVVTVPELPGCRTDGSTYEEAISQAQEAIEAWVESAMADSATLPGPQHYQHRSACAQP